MLPDELKPAIVLFYSLLDERQPPQAPTMTAQPSSLIDLAYPGPSVLCLDRIKP